MPEQEERIRTIAGYLLKNNVRLILSAPPEVTIFVKAAVLHAFIDASIMIRNSAGQAIVALLGCLEPKNWPEALEQLVTMLDSQELDRQEVSIIFFSYFSSCTSLHDRVVDPASGPTQNKACVRVLALFAAVNRAYQSTSID